jgi:spermidine synthase
MASVYGTLSQKCTAKADARYHLPILKKRTRNTRKIPMLIRRKSIEADANTRQGPGNVKPPPARRKVKYAPVTLSEADGVRYLHFGTEWVQGAMRLRKPDTIELEYAQQMMAWMLFLPQPQHIVQLGLGTGALTKFSYRQFPAARVTAIELNPSVITICGSMFKLPPDDDRLSVLEMDALDYVNDEQHHATIDAIQVDLYDATARGPVLDTPAFYSACAACLQEDGIMTVNLFGDHPSFAKNLKAMRFAFAHVVALPEVHDGNVVAIAFKQKPALNFALLHEQAAQILAATKLPAKSWVNGIKAAVAGTKS